MKPNMEPNMEPNMKPNMQPYEHLHIMDYCDPALLVREEDQSTEEQKEEETDCAEVDSVIDPYGDRYEEEDWEYLDSEFPRDVEVSSPLSLSLSLFWALFSRLVVNTFLGYYVYCT